jgi:oligopeptide/dipeptide ABC transporter ATP-binding protein
LEAIPSNENRRGRLGTIAGRVAPAWEWDDGCRFRDRCAHAVVACAHHVTQLERVGGHAVRCVRSEELRLDVRSES